MLLKICRGCYTIASFRDSEVENEEATLIEVEEGLVEYKSKSESEAEFEFDGDIDNWA